MDVQHALPLNPLVLATRFKQRLCRALNACLLLCLLAFAASSAWADTLRTYAGNPVPNGLATNIGASANGVVVDSAGLLYVTDISNHTVRRIDPATGQSTVIAGIGRSGFSGDGGAATSAMLNAPRGVAVDSAGNVYIADTSNHRIRKINTSGVISTFAGTGTSTFAGDGNAATAANFNNPQSVAVDGAGNVFIADTGNARIRQVSVGGTVTTVAGTGFAGYQSDNVAATSTRINSPRGVVPDGTGAFYILDTGNHRIRKVSADGIITTVAGTGSATASGDGGVATSAGVRAPTGLALDGSGNLYISDTSNRIRKVSAGVITTLAGTGTSGFSGDGGAPASAQINSPQGLAVDSTGTVYVADSNNVRVRKISGGLISTLAGTGSSTFGGDGGDALNAQFTDPRGVVRDSVGNVYVADGIAHRIRKISPAGTVTTLAGTGAQGYSGDNGPASSAQLYNPMSIALDSSGNVYFSDLNNHRIRKIDTSGNITTVAGNGVGGFAGDGGAATSARIFVPYGLVVDSQGNLFIADTGNDRIRKVDTAGIITTWAGTGVSGFTNGAAASAKFNAPLGLAIDSADSLYVVDFGNNAIRKIAGGMVSTVVGTGAGGFTGDGAAATSATLNAPRAVVVDAANKLYIADTGNHRVRQVDSSGVITTVAGAGTSGFSGDGDVPTSAQFSSPWGLSLFGSMGLLIVDNGNRRVRLLAFADPPGAPTVVTATAGNASATVSFAAPAANGSSAITGYTVVSSPAGGTDSNAGSTALSHVVTGLTNGVSYTFTVVASNLAGPGPASSPSNSVVPISLVNGVCGAATNVSSLFMPSTNLCSAGSASAVSNSSPWRWNCVGSNGGSTAMCSAPVGQTVSGTGASRVSVAGSSWVVDQVGTTNGQPNTAGAIRVTGDAKSPPDPAPAGYVFAHGLYDFTLTGGTGPATVVINYPTALPLGTVYWKYGKTSPAGAARWYIFPGAVISEDRMSISLTLSDGALGDDDGTVNGVITDPGGPGLPLNATTAVPTLSPWALAILGLLLMLLTRGLRGAGVSRSADVAGR